MPELQAALHSVHTIIYMYSYNSIYEIVLLQFVQQQVTPLPYDVAEAEILIVSKQD